MNRHVPAIFITLLKNWYEKSEICVRWNSFFSDVFKITAGVRQGGILSPMLFLVYVNDMLVKLTKRGCSIMRRALEALMYADDITLISPSVFELQAIISVCESELQLLDLKLNSFKSLCLRID